MAICIMETDHMRMWSMGGNRARQRMEILEKNGGFGNSNLNLPPVLDNLAGFEESHPECAEQSGKFYHIQSHLVDKRVGRRDDGLYAFDQGKDRSRVIESLSKANKGKDILVHSRKNKSRYQKPGVGAGAITLEKRRVGEKMSDSPDSESLSSSDQGFWRGECSISHEERQVGLGLMSIGLKLGQLSVVLGPSQKASRSTRLFQEPDPLVSTFKEFSDEGNRDLLIGSKDCVEAFSAQEISSQSIEGNE
ncbi:hypothetical protein QYF36_009717 [Acer negundo]|nr:hypothetical protein QYF36_009717 [Acer negundo]